MAAKMLEFTRLTSEFLEKIRDAEVEVYNEASLQFELAGFLRATLPSQFKVQFERPVDLFKIPRKGLLKKEIDLVLFRSGGEGHYAIELKYPRNGQYPEQMFKFCEDLGFIEQLTERGFDGGCLLVLVEDKLFYSGRETDGIYGYFRCGQPLQGVIKQPTKAKGGGGRIKLRGRYTVEWKPVRGSMKYLCLQVGAKTPRDLENRSDGSAMIMEPVEPQSPFGRSDIIQVDPEILGGSPVFRGTRVLVSTLLDYLEEGSDIEEFLDDFPSVRRDQAVAVLEQAKKALVSDARPA